MFKQAISIDQNDLIDTFHTASANVRDIKLLSVLLSFISNAENRVKYADKGFKTLINDELLRSMKFKNKIMHKKIFI